MKRRIQPGEARPRIKIYRDGRATLSGISYQDLRWILDSAAVSYYDDLKKVQDPQNVAVIRAQMKVMDALKGATDKAIRDTYLVRTHPLTKKERLQIVREARSERILLDEITIQMRKASRQESRKRDSSART